MATEAQGNTERRAFMDSNAPLWGETLKRILRLKELDRGRAAFAADHHRYLFGPPVTEQMVAACEARLGVRLPKELRAYYLELGNGGAGPECGVFPLHKLEVDDLRGWEASDRKGRIPFVRVARRVFEGCLIMRCVDPPDEEAWYLDGSSNQVPGTCGWVARIESWLDGELPYFERAEELRLLGHAEAAIADMLLAEGAPASIASRAAEGVCAVAPEPTPPEEVGRAWHRILQRILRLKELDRGKNAFGVSGHEYRTSGPVPEATIAACETRLRIRLPPQLRAYYLEIGNGGPGPYYGVSPLEELEVLVAGSWRPGHGPESGDTRFVPVIDYGCGIYLCVACGAPTDLVHWFEGDEDELYLGNHDWLGQFDAWLDKELPVYERGAELLRGGADAAAVIRTLEEEFPEYCACRDVVAGLEGRQRWSRLPNPDWEEAEKRTDAWQLRQWSGHWYEVAQRIFRLVELDREFGAFGARTHRYAFGAQVSPQLLADHEKRLGGALPTQLRTYYLTLGNGGPGPYYGVLPLEELAARPTGVWGRVRRMFGGQREILVAAIHTGCGRFLYARAGTAATEEVLDPEPTGRDWLGEFTRWLDEELPVFERAAALAAEDASEAEIAARLKQEFPGYSFCEQVAMSVRGNPEAREL